MNNISSFKRSLSIIITLLGLCSYSLASAQTSIDEKNVMAVVDKSIKEYRVYATCMSMDEMSLKAVKETWNLSRKEALQNLKSDGASLLFLARFALATEDSKILDADMKLSEAIPYCHKNRKQLEQFFELGYTHLEQEIYKLQQKSK